MSEEINDPQLTIDVLRKANVLLMEQRSRRDTKIAALEAEVVELRIENSELSRKVGFLGGVIQGVTHWNIPPELKTKLQGEVLKMTTALNSTKGEK